MSELLAGVCRVNITPPIGVPMVGFAGRGPAQAVHDDLVATVLALQCGDTRALIAAADLLYFPDTFAGAARNRISARATVPREHILLSASHNHYGPAIAADSGADPIAAAYGACLLEDLAGAAEAAFARLEPVGLGVGVGECAIGINRREQLPNGDIILGNNPNGPCDRSVRLVRLDSRGGRPLAALVNVACHGVSAAHAMREIGPDFVGVMRRIAEPATAATCMFLQGAAGDINPVEMRHSWEPARRLGTMLGAEVAHVFETTPTGPAEGLAVASEVAELPALTFGSLEEGEQALAALNAEVERLTAAGDGARWWAEHRRDRAARAVESLRTGVPLPPVSAGLWALRLGDVALVTAPAEVFNETGAEIRRRSPLPATCFVGYTNGSVGYVPTPSAYPEGGYEVTHACNLAPGATGILIERSTALLARVAAA